MLSSLFFYEGIDTTQAKAKNLRRMADRAITIAKRGDLAARRRLSELIPEQKAIKKLLEVIIPRFTERKSGYTRIIKKGFRRGDNAPLVLIELIGREIKKPRKKKKEKSPRQKRAKKASPKEK
jgi:large subunit ribosomal protein L17